MILTLFEVYLILKVMRYTRNKVFFVKQSMNSFAYYCMEDNSVFQFAVITNNLFSLGS